MSHQKIQLNVSIHKWRRGICCKTVRCFVVHSVTTEEKSVATIGNEGRGIPNEPAQIVPIAVHQKRFLSPFAKLARHHPRSRSRRISVRSGTSFHLGKGFPGGNAPCQYRETKQTEKRTFPSISKLHRRAITLVGALSSILQQKRRNKQSQRQRTRRTERSDVEGALFPVSCSSHYQLHSYLSLNFFICSRVPASRFVCVNRTPLKANTPGASQTCDTLN